MKRSFICFFILTVIFNSNLIFAGGEEAFYPYDPENIKTVKGQARSCEILVGEDGPNSKAFFDSNGRLVKYERGYGNQVVLYKYDTSGRMIESIEGSGEPDNFSQNAKITFTYDKSGKLTGIDTNFGEGTYQMFQVNSDKSGNPVVDELTPEGSVYKSRFFSNDLKIQQLVSYDSEQLAMGKKIVGYTITYNYKDGFLTEESIVKNIDKKQIKISKKYQYKFDSKGNKIEESFTVDPSDSVGRYYDLPLTFPKVVFKYNYSGDFVTADIKENKDTSTVKNDKKDSTKKDEGKKNLKGTKVSVEWNGEWYDAKIIDQKEDEYLIHYDGYDSSWDEWVTQDRIKFKDE